VQQIRERLTDFIKYCTEKEIPLITAAGNKDNGPGAVTDTLPQKLSVPYDSMVIVGAVNEAGEIHPKTKYDPFGVITVYAPGTNIAAPTNGNEILVHEGTSQAAAIVVCASFLTPQYSLIFHSLVLLPAITVWLIRRHP
jgi:hypothetical protein